MHTLFPALLCALALRTGAETVSSGKQGIYLPAHTKYQSPRFRYWWPSGLIEPETVADEIADMIQSGFGGAEIADDYDTDPTPMDPEVYGFGESRWNAGVKSAYRKANSMGGHVDLTIGPSWPTGFPGYTPDSPETMKELVHGQAFLDARQKFSGKLPLPVAAPAGNHTGNIVHTTPILVAVLAARTTTTNNSATVVDIVPSSVRDITKHVSHGHLTWTAPKDGRYVVVAAYYRGTGQIQRMYDFEASHFNAPVMAGGPAYIVNHLSKAGVEAGIKFYEKHILTDDVRELLKKSNGSFFEDSVEINLLQYWTEGFDKEFKSRRGYSLIPFLLYVFKDTNTFNGDATVATQILNDFYQTVTDMYTEYRTRPLTEWANSLGLWLRFQPYTYDFNPYTLAMDSSYLSSLADIPEAESLAFGGDDDAFRILSAGRDIAGRTTIMSDEIGAFPGMAYGTTWRYLLSTLNLHNVLGVTQAVLHGFAYRYSHVSRWPGFSPFTPVDSPNQFANAWGPRMPQWMFAKSCSGFMGRGQKLLQESGPSIDIAILNTVWGFVGRWTDTNLNIAGYTYQLPTPNLLAQYKVGVNNKRLAPDGPAYKALIVTNASLDVTTVESILSYGKKGLPIVLVGPRPSTTFGYTPDADATSKHLGKLFDKISNLKTTRAVDSTSGVVGALQDLDVQPSAKYLDNSDNSIVTYKRTADVGNLFWFFNYNSQSAVSRTVSLEGEGSPYEIDRWTGEITPIPAFVEKDGYVTINISMQPSSSYSVYLGTSNPWGAPKLGSSIIDTTCGSDYKDGEAHIFSNVSCAAKTSTGKDIQLDPGSLPKVVVPSGWTLQVEDWAPKHINETGAQSGDTAKTLLPLIQLTELQPWANITALEYASGIGTYNTTVPLVRNAHQRVLLNIGRVEGTFGVSVNGRAVDNVNQFMDKPIDVTGYVHSGSNDISIIVATTLWNKLRLTWPESYGGEDPQTIGLIGPVSVSYVGDRVVDL